MSKQRCAWHEMRADGLHRRSVTRDWQKEAAAENSCVKPEVSVRPGEGR